MKFEHLVEINDPRNPLLYQLTREQIWRGLVLGAEAPKLFIPHLDECQLLESGKESLTRQLRYGKLVVTDKVTFMPQQYVRYLVAAQQDIVASSLTMRIEEPLPGSLFVRFEYDDGQGENADEEAAMYNDFRHAAYKAADIDTIHIIRELAQQGRFNAMLN